MKKFVKTLLAAAVLSIAGAAAASAGTISLSISNGSAKTIYVDAVPVCNNCTTSSATSIAAGGSGTSTATTTAGATAATYSIDYSNYFGTSFTEKGCRATITVEVTSGLITKVISYSWVAYTGNPTCSTLSSPSLNGSGGVNWSVRFRAS